MILIIINGSEHDDAVIGSQTLRAVQRCVRATTGRRRCDCAVDDYVDTRACCGLQQTVHGPRHQHHDQEAGETEAGRLLVHGPSRPLHLAVYRAVVRRRQFCAVPRQSLQPTRVADRGPRERSDVYQRLHHIQQPLVRTRCFHAPGNRHLAQVFTHILIYRVDQK